MRKNNSLQSFYLSGKYLSVLPPDLPKTVLSFDCSDNNLDSLIGSPETVKITFNCAGNSLTSLQYSPNNVGGDYYCYQNSLTSLNGAPLNISNVQIINYQI